MHIVTATTVARGANPLGDNQSPKPQAVTENVKGATSQHPFLIQQTWLSIQMQANFPRILLWVRLSDM